MADLLHLLLVYALSLPFPSLRIKRTNVFYNILPDITLLLNNFKIKHENLFIKNPFHTVYQFHNINFDFKKSFIFRKYCTDWRKAVLFTYYNLINKTIIISSINMSSAVLDLAKFASIYLHYMH